MPPNGDRVLCGRVPGSEGIRRSLVREKPETPGHAPPSGVRWDEFERPLGAKPILDLPRSQDPGAVVIDLARHLVVLIASTILDHPGASLAIAGVITGGLMNEKRGENQEVAGPGIQGHRVCQIQRFLGDDRVDALPDMRPVTFRLGAGNHLEAPVRRLRIIQGEPTSQEFLGTTALVPIVLVPGDGAPSAG